MVGFRVQLNESGWIYAYMEVSRQEAHSLRFRVASWLRTLRTTWLEQLLLINTMKRITIAFLSIARESV